MGRGVEAVKDLQGRQAHRVRARRPRRRSRSAHQRRSRRCSSRWRPRGRGRRSARGGGGQRGVGLRVHIGCGYRVKAEVAGALGQHTAGRGRLPRGDRQSRRGSSTRSSWRRVPGLALIKEAGRQRGEAQKLRSSRGRHLQPAPRRRGDRVSRAGWTTSTRAKRLAGGGCRRTSAVCTTLRPQATRQSPSGARCATRLSAGCPGTGTSRPAHRPRSDGAVQADDPDRAAARHRDDRDGERRGLPRSRSRRTAGKVRTPIRAGLTSRHVRRAAARGSRAPRSPCQPDGVTDPATDQLIDSVRWARRYRREEAAGRSVRPATSYEMRSRGSPRMVLRVMRRGPVRRGARVRARSGHRAWHPPRAAVAGEGQQGADLRRAHKLLLTRQPSRGLAIAERSGISS